MPAVLKSPALVHMGSISLCVQVQYNNVKLKRSQGVESLLIGICTQHLVGFHVNIVWLHVNKGMVVLYQFTNSNAFLFGAYFVIIDLKFSKSLVCL